MVWFAAIGKDVVVLTKDHFDGDGNEGLFFGGSTGFVVGG